MQHYALVAPRRSGSSASRFVRKKVVTSTYAYDNDGNLVQKTTDGTTTSYVYDYANRLIALGVSGATTTYGYDAFGARVLQIGTSTTNLYPFKWFSVASSTASGAKYSTTTEYVFNGDSLVATIDQQTAGGAATGTAQTRYIHPDHLGSTNVVTNASGTVVQTLDYYPYGATRISSSVGGADSARKYIGQFSDQSNLSYLNARYMEPSRGQFLSEEPIFLAIGEANQVKQLSQKDQQTYLSNPQQLNSYSYSKNNPITLKDPSGKDAVRLNFGIGGEAGFGITGLGSFGIAWSYGIGAVFGWNPETGDRWVRAPVESSGSQVSYSTSDVPLIAGASAGGNVGLTYWPTATTPADVAGTQYNANVNVGRVALSAQGLQTKSPSYSISTGPGVGYSASYYPITTTVKNSWMNFNWTGAPLSSMQTAGNTGGRSQSGSSSGGGGSSPALVGLYQQLVSTLSSIVSILQSSSR
jgi:RHS repeat-associated protein